MTSATNERGRLENKDAATQGAPLERLSPVLWRHILAEFLPLALWAGQWREVSRGFCALVDAALPLVPTFEIPSDEDPLRHLLIGPQVVARLTGLRVLSLGWAISPRRRDIKALLARTPQLRSLSLNVLAVAGGLSSLLDQLVTRNLCRLDVDGGTLVDSPLIAQLAPHCLALERFAWTLHDASDVQSLVRWLVRDHAQTLRSLQLCCVEQLQTVLSDALAHFPALEDLVLVADRNQTVPVMPLLALESAFAVSSSSALRKVSVLQGYRRFRFDLDASAIELPVGAYGAPALLARISHLCLGIAFPAFSDLGAFAQQFAALPESALAGLHTVQLRLAPSIEMAFDALNGTPPLKTYEMPLVPLDAPAELDALQQALRLVVLRCPRLRRLELGSAQCIHLPASQVVFGLRPSLTLTVPAKNNYASAMLLWLDTLRQQLAAALAGPSTLL